MLEENPRQQLASDLYVPKEHYNDRFVFVDCFFLQTSTDYLPEENDYAVDVERKLTRRNPVNLEHVEPAS